MKINPFLLRLTIGVMLCSLPGLAMSKARHSHIHKTHSKPRPIQEYFVKTSPDFANKDVQYILRGNGYILGLTTDGYVMHIQDKAGGEEVKDGRWPGDSLLEEPGAKWPLVKLKLWRPAEVTASNFHGTEAIQKGVFKKICLHEAFLKIDWCHDSSDGKADKQTFILKPGASSYLLQYYFAGAKVKPYKHGLMLEFGKTEKLYIEPPHAFQDGQEVSVNFALKEVGSEYIITYKLGSYNPKKSLEIH